MRKLGCNPEASEPDVAVIVDEYVRRLDVLVDEALLMDLADCFRQSNDDAQQSSQIERLSLAPLQNQIQGLTAWVLQYENRPPFVTNERQRLSGPRGLEFACERVFVLESPQALRRRLFGSKGHCQNRRWVALLPAA